jgi:hypothetical protein
VAAHTSVGVQRAQKLGLGAAEREGIVARNLRIQSEARTLLSKWRIDFANPNDEMGAYRQLVSLRPFPTVTVGSFLRDKSPRVRATAARVIGQVGDGSAAQSLASAAIADTDAAVRSAAADAIRSMRDPRPFETLVKCAAHVKSEPYVTRAADAIRSVGHTAAVDRLITYAMLEVRLTVTGNAQMQTLNIRGETFRGDRFTTTEYPIQLPSIDVFQVRTTVAVPTAIPVLRALTGQNFGGDVAAWGDWWKANRNDFKL